MSIVIVGGHDRMVCQYKKICKHYKCRAKVFTQMSANLDKQLGTPDLFILFTNTVSHKMVKTAIDEAKKKEDQCRTLSYEQRRSIRTHSERICRVICFVCLIRTGLFVCPQRASGRRGREK